MWVQVCTVNSGMQFLTQHSCPCRRLNKLHRSISIKSDEKIPNSFSLAEPRGPTTRCAINLCQRRVSHVCWDQHERGDGEIKNAAVRSSSIIAACTELYSGSEQSCLHC